MRLCVHGCFRPVLLSACVLGLTAGTIHAAGGGDKLGQPKNSIPAMLKDRLDTLQKIYDLTVKAQKDGKAPTASVHQAKMALLHAQLEMAQNKQEYLKIREQILKESEFWEQAVKAMVKDGKATEIDVLQTHLDTLDARIALEAAKQDKGPPGPNPPGGK